MDASLRRIPHRSLIYIDPWLFPISWLQKHIPLYMYCLDRILTVVVLMFLADLGFSLFGATSHFDCLIHFRCHFGAAVVLVGVQESLIC